MTAADAATLRASAQALRTEAATVRTVSGEVRQAWETFGTALSNEETKATQIAADLEMQADSLERVAMQVEGQSVPLAPPVTPPVTPPSGIVIPPVPNGFQIVTAWDFTKPTFPTGWKDDGLTFNYGDRGNQKLDCVNLMRNVIYNPTKGCWEIWGRKEDYAVPGSSGYWATAHYTSASISVEANWLPGMMAQVFARLNDQHRAAAWSSHGPDEFDFCEHFFSDAPQYNPKQSDHWAVITSYSPVKQYTPVKPALIDGKPHMFWCDYLSDGGNVKMGRDSTTMNTVPKANLHSATMSHGIRVSEQMGGTWDGGYDAVQQGKWPSIQIPNTPSCTDLYMVRLLKKAA